MRAAVAGRKHGKCGHRRQEILRIIAPNGAEHQSPGSPKAHPGSPREAAARPMEPHRGSTVFRCQATPVLACGTPMGFGADRNRGGTGSGSFPGVRLWRSRATICHPFRVVVRNLTVRLYSGIEALIGTRRKSLSTRVSDV